jgi:hypothetical protein
MEVIPDDLVRKCLQRVPYASHDDLKAVCRSWEAIVGSPEFYTDRKISGTSEQLLCLIHRDPRAHLAFVITVHDPVNGTWKRLPPIDDPLFAGITAWSQCVAVNRKLVLIGGFYPLNTTLTKCVYIYDFESAKWSRRADMPTARSFFAFCVSSSTGLVYVAGGNNERNDPLAAAEAYNVEEDRWEILPPMIQPHGPGCYGVFMDGKFMVLSRDRSAEVFDPTASTWRRWEDMISFRVDLWRSFAVACSSSGELYAFSERQQQVMKYDGGKQVWTVVASLPRHIYLFKCATQCGDHIFVSGMDNPGKHISYLFKPSTGQWSQVNGDGDEGSVGVIVSAATVEI